MSKTALRREARRQELEDMGADLALRMKKLEERTNKVRLEDQRREREFQERMKKKAEGEANKLQAAREDAYNHREKYISNVESSEEL